MTTLHSQFPNPKAVKARIVKRNTFERHEDGDLIIRLHETDIVRKHSDGSVTLNSAGWKTLTTKDRMNDYLPAPYRLSQCAGQWSINGVPYFDGMIIPRDVETPKAKGAALAAKEKSLRKQIRKFVCDVPLKGPFPEPGNGDCWYCLMKTQDGKSLGETMGDNSHIMAHIEERYLHGSLILNALKWAGRNPQVVFQMGLGDSVRRALKRYLYRQCGLVA